jgi:hypothetical protein
LTQIAKPRLVSQQIAGTKFLTAKEIVAWMGAMQAQNYAMAKWAIGVRLPNSTDRDIETALDNGEVLRTHLLRPTWHLVSADDIYWMLELTAPHIKASQKSRHKQLALSETVFAKSNSIIGKALSNGEHLTRDELVAELHKAKIATDENRAAHLLFWAELDGISCSGATKGGKPTHALLEKRAPKPKSISREEALAKLAGKYFTSHGPATLQDFVWWSGLPAGDAKIALEMAKPGLVSEEFEKQTYWLSGSISVTGQESIYLLPAYDEFIISYKDRSAALPFEHFSKAVSNNGIFRPVILVSGQVVGIWKRTIKKDKVFVETELFTKLNKATMALIAEAVLPFGRFLEKQTEVK